MSRREFLRRVTCRVCQEQQLWGPDEALEYLRSRGKFRRDSRPDPEAIMALIVADPPSCPECRATDVAFEPVSDDEDWGEVRCCEVCRRPIPDERLEVFPDAKRCVGCQDLPAENMEPAEFCPRCGGTMQLQHRSAGRVSNYQFSCKGCGYRPR